MSSALRRAGVIVWAAAVAGLVAAWIAGGILCGRLRRAQGDTNDRSGEPVRIASRSGSTLRGRFFRGETGHGVVVLLHGIYADRSVMLPRASFLRHRGYSVLLCDFAAHGESTGDRTTFGYRERWDVAVEVEYAQSRCPGERTGVIGVSMGGAAAIMASPLPIHALVLESVYPAIEDAVSDRITERLGAWSVALAPLLTAQLPLRVGFRAADLRPIDHVAAIRVPKLFLAGTADRSTTIEESRRLFRAAADPKELWEVSGARHQDLYAFAPREYERRVGSFLCAHLARAGAVPLL